MCSMLVNSYMHTVLESVIVHVHNEHSVAMVVMKFLE